MTGLCTYRSELICFDIVASVVSASWEHKSNDRLKSFLIHQVKRNKRAKLKDSEKIESTINYADKTDIWKSIVIEQKEKSKHEPWKASGV